MALAIGSLLCGTEKLGALVMFCQGTENPAGSHLPRKDIGVHLMSPREDESREQTASPRCHRWPRTAGPDGRVLSAGRGRHVHPAPCPSIRLPGFLYTDKGTRGPPSFPFSLWGGGGGFLKVLTHAGLCHVAVIHTFRRFAVGFFS